MTADLNSDEATDLPAVTAAEPQAIPQALPIITPEQARVLGCLLEKEQTTPDYYPLTLNALVTACNQSTNRDPVVSYDERTVQEALEGLKQRQFALQVTLAGARVQKFKHNTEHKLPWLERPHVALLTTLLLRGPQTVGELRQRSERIQIFPDLTAVEETLQQLMGADHGAPLVVCFPPGPGRKSALYVHTLCGTPEAPAAGVSAAATIVYAPPPPTVDEEWKARVEGELSALREELAALKSQLGVE